MRKGFTSVLVFVVILLVLASGLGAYFLASNNILLQQLQLSQNTISEKSVTLNSGKITYLKEGNLYLLDNKGIEQLTFNENINNFKWSPDGNHLGWIKRKRFQNQFSNGSSNSTTLGISLYVLNLRTGEKEEIVSQHLTDGEISAKLTANNKKFSSKIPYEFSIEGFDFSNDSKQVAYTRDGLWLKDLDSGQEEKLKNNYYDPSDNLNFLTYLDVQWSPKDPLIMLRQGYPFAHSSRHEFYNLETKKIEDVGYGDIPPHYHQLWSPDGKNILTYRSYGAFGDGGLWLTNIQSKKTTGLLDFINPQKSKKTGISAISADIAEDGNIIAILETNPALPGNVENIYEISMSGNVTQLTSFDNSNTEYVREYIDKISISPDGKKIAYLSCTGKNNLCSKNLHLMSVDGKEDKILLTNISDYVWSSVQ